MTPRITKLPDGYVVGQRVVTNAKYRRINPKSKLKEGVVMGGAMGGRGLRVRFENTSGGWCRPLEPSFVDRA